MNDDILDIIRNSKVKVLFGLRAQGHLPTIERMLSEGRDWDEIGKAIGWCPDTAKAHYELVDMREANHQDTAGVIVCPWCAHEHEDVDWSPEGGDGRCEKCGQAFRFEAEFTVSWTTQRIEEGGEG